MRYRRQRGLTIIEIMVALAIGLLLTAGVIQVYISSNQNYRLQESLSRIQENGRYALEVLTRELRMADFDAVGCDGDFQQPVMNTLNNQAYGYDVIAGFEGRTAIVGHQGNGDGTWTPEMVLTIDNAVSGTDAFTVIGDGLLGGTNPPILITNDPPDTGGAATIQLATIDGFETCDLVFVVTEDCQNAALTQATGFKGNQNVIHNAGAGCTDTVPGGNSDQDLGAGFTGGQAVNASGQRRNTYYVGEDVDGKRGLWRKREGGTASERVEGVERMQITWGVDTNGNLQVNEYMTAQDVENADAWLNVVAVRISLLLVGPADNVVDEAQTLTFAGETIDASDTSDRRLRQIYTTTVGVRNRLR